MSKGEAEQPHRGIRNSLFDIGHSRYLVSSIVGSAVQTVGVDVEFVEMFCSLTESHFLQ